MFVAIRELKTIMISKAYARLLFIGVHGHAKIHTIIKEFSFEVTPELVEAADKNELTYKFLNLDLDIKEVVFDEIHLGGIPDWLTKLLFNAVSKIIVGVYEEFRGEIDAKIVEALNQYRVILPEHLEIPTTPLSLSTSFPDLPHFYPDRIEVPFDGTLFVSAEGYNITDRTIPKRIPTYDTRDKNNVQSFLSEYVLNSVVKDLQHT